MYMGTRGCMGPRGPMGHGPGPTAPPRPYGPTPALRPHDPTAPSRPLGPTAPRFLVPGASLKFTNIDKFVQIVVLSELGMVKYLVRKLLADLV